MGGKGSDGVEEGARVVGDGGGFEFEFLEAAIAEFLEVSGELLL